MKLQFFTRRDGIHADGEHHDAYKLGLNFIYETVSPSAFLRCASFAFFSSVGFLVSENAFLVLRLPCKHGLISAITLQLTELRRRQNLFC